MYLFYLNRSYIPDPELFRLGLLRFNFV